MITQEPLPTFLVEKYPRAKEFVTAYEAKFGPHSRQPLGHLCC